MRKNQEGQSLLLTKTTKRAVCNRVLCRVVLDVLQKTKTSISPLALGLIADLWRVDPIQTNNRRGKREYAGWT